jgi:DNA-binding transcriptional LysR family regulator
MHITIRQMEQFIAIAEERSFTRAAERLGMGQPPLSQSLARLEKNIGARLVNRTSRNMDLTAAGLAFLEDCRDIVTRTQGATIRARYVAQGITEHLSVGFVVSSFYREVPSKLAAFQKLNPQIRLTLEEMTTPAQIEALRVGTKDIGFLRMAGSRYPGLSSILLLREGLVAAIPTNHPLAHAHVVELSELRNDSFISFPAETAANAQSLPLDACRLAGFQPRIVQEAVQMQTIVSLVSGGMGVALVPESLMSLQRSGVLYKPISYPGKVQLNLHAAWRTDNPSQPLRSLLQIIRRMREKSPSSK